MHSDTHSTIKGYSCENSLAYIFGIFQGSSHPSNPILGPCRGQPQHPRLTYPPQQCYKWFLICQNQSRLQQGMNRSWPDHASCFQLQQTQDLMGPHRPEYCTLSPTKKILSSWSFFPRCPRELSCSYLKFKPQGSHL